MIFRLRLIKDQLVAAIILILAVFFSALIIQVNAQSSSRNASISLKKDSNNLFIITIRDPQGIKEFSLQPPGKFSYGGEISGCPTSRKIDNVVFDDPTDFTPAMNAYIVDCSENKDELQIPPPKDGVTAAVRVGVPEEPAKTEVKKETSKSAAPSGEKVFGKPVKSGGGSSPKSDVKYPVAELGNCGSEFECRVYCDKPGNIEKCLDYAEKNNLIKSDEIERGRKFKKVLDAGHTPGSCDSQQGCEVYCNDTDHLNECISFGEQNGFLSGKELEEAKKIHEIVKAGRKLPGDCRNKTACEAYCKNPGHMEECIAFAEESGFISGEELAEAKKFLPLIQKGETPGACKSKEECEVFCDSDEHMDECIDFAVKHDLIPEKERDHIEAFKKAGGKGPGGCKGRQCQAFCENPANQKACFQWAKENGMLREEDLQRMEEGKQQLKKALEQMPPEAKECVEAIIGPGGLEGDFFGGPEIGDKMRGCFEQAFSKFGGPGGPGGPGGFPGGGFEGPGGCKSQEECQAYCTDNPDECQDFHPPEGGFPSGPGGGMPGGGFGGGPGGCQSIDECMAYCQDNPEECQGFGPPGGAGGGFPGGPGGGEGNDGFSACGISAGTPAEFVCGINGKGALPGKETTYFNECHAKQHGAEILHEGVCKGHNPCSDIADPVCGNDNNSWTSACHAESEGGGVKHKGICTREDSGQQGGFPSGPPGGVGFPGGPGGGGFPGGIPSGEKYVGPGGCATPDECIRYCKIPGNKEECDNFHTKERPPGPPQGRGPGGCSSVEECREYCTHNNSKECDAFTSEGGDEIKCQPNWEIKKDNQGYRYCSPRSCPEGTHFVVTDKFGRQACSPVEVPSSSGNQELRQRIGENPLDKLREGFGVPPGAPSSNQYQQQFQQQYQQEFQKQYEQQYQNFQSPTGLPGQGSYPAPSGSYPNYTPPPNFFPSPTNVTPPPTQTAPPPPTSQGPKMPKFIFLMGRLVTMLLGGN